MPLPQRDFRSLLQEEQQQEDRGNDATSIIGQSAEIMNQMISVERVLEFGNLAPEAPLNKNLTKTWTAPGQAMVKFMCKTSQ
jgi:hypothetical protein